MDVGQHSRAIFELLLSRRTNPASEDPGVLFGILAVPTAWLRFDQAWEHHFDSRGPVHLRQVSMLQVGEALGRSVISQQSNVSRLFPGTVASRWCSFCPRNLLVYFEDVVSMHHLLNICMSTDLSLSLCRGV